MKKALRSYITGFIMSIFLTAGAFIAVSAHALETSNLLSLILGLAFVQLVVQLTFFLGKESKSRLNLTVLLATFSMLVVLVGGSIWIMNHLNENMMRMTPQQMNNYFSNQDNGGY